VAAKLVWDTVQLALPPLRDVIAQELLIAVAKRSEALALASKPIGDKPKQAPRCAL
jgi:hypothetical protein